MTLQKICFALTMLHLVVMTTCTVNISLPLLEPTVPSGQGSLLGDLTSLVRDAAWPGDGGAVVADPAGRRQLEADRDSLQRAATNRSLAVTLVTPAVLSQAAASAGLTVSQPIASIDACLIWRRQHSSTRVQAGVNRDGLYFLTVFHSSVWSVLLLCLLLAISLLTILEAAHPIGMRSSHARLLNRKGENNKPMGTFDALAFATAALLLVGYPRTPRSSAGRVLGIVWWLFAFTIAMAYLSATVLVFLTTRGEPALATAGLTEILDSTSSQSIGRTVLCASGEPLCAEWARPEPLARANFTPVESDSAGLEQLRLHQSNANEPPLLLLTHQFACTNLMAIDNNGSYSVGILAKSIAWLSLAGPTDLVRQANDKIIDLLAKGRFSQLEKRYKLTDVEVYDVMDATGRGLVSEWLTELRLGLPYRIGSIYGVLVLLLVGFGLTLLTAAGEFSYYRFYYEPDVEEDDIEGEELEAKQRAVSVGATMDTYL